MDVKKLIAHRTHNSMPAVLARLAFVVLATLLAGCAVPQQRGTGQQFYKQEPQTGRGYWLYLPEDYAQGIRANPNRRWPVVVSFHGMKPFDNSTAQAKEWQYEADNYGLIVLAPALKTSDLMMEFPLRKMHNYVHEDEQAVLNMMEQVFRTTQADSTRVLATSWSSGGYMAHYMVNRHPNLFTCLAPRQSNFSSEILESANIPYYQDMPIGVFFGENDFAVCRAESTEAIKWYKERNFKFIDGRVVIGLGHERTPQTAAAFFARVSKPPILPVRPALAQETLARLRLIPAEFAGIAELPPNEPSISQRSPADELARAPLPISDRSPTDEILKPSVPPNGNPAPGASAGAPARPRLLAGNPPAPPAAAAPPNKPPAGKPGKTSLPPAAPAPAPASVRVITNPKIGLAPLYISFDVQAPTEILQGGSCLWTDNDEPVCNSPTGQRIITAPGDHVISVVIQTKDHREYRAWTTVKVLSPQPAMR
jgi:poly(3-hydroxybutyrate) depolymerase